MKRRKICVVTTSRADFGHLRGLLEVIREDSALRLQLIASGMHLSREFGSTWREIEEAGFRIDRKINQRVTGRTELENVKSLSIGLTAFATAFAERKPAIVVLLGDRFEILAPAVAALMLRIPIAHIHGGELSEGAIDDSVRHAITKMASLHFAATETYRRRIIQMGEKPDRVFDFGAPGLDQLHGAPLLSRDTLERELGFRLQGPTALVTYHPVTRGDEDAEAQVKCLLGAIQASGLRAIFTMANADSQGARINTLLQSACERNPERFLWFPHLGNRRYLSLLKFLSIMLGNSSSGLTEAPSFHLPVVNIGDRQRGRVKAANVIDVPCTRQAIQRGIQKALSPHFLASLRGMSNPYDRYGDGRVSERIKNVLKRALLNQELLKKSFHDLPSIPTSR